MRHVPFQYLQDLSLDGILYHFVDLLFYSRGKGGAYIALLAQSGLRSICYLANVRENLGESFRFSFGVNGGQLSMVIRGVPKC